MFLVDNKGAKTVSDVISMVEISENEMRRVRLIAFLAIAFSTMTILICILLMPISYEQIQRIQSVVSNEIDFCKSKNRNLWSEVLAVQTAYGAVDTATRTARSVRKNPAGKWLFGHFIPASPQKTEQPGYGAHSFRLEDYLQQSPPLASEGVPSLLSAKKCTCHYGPQGLPGAPGKNGKNGSNGRSGPNGPPGQSAPADFNLMECNRECPPGPPGLPGSPGEKGPKGYTGPVGEPGTPGKIGETGPRGPDGPPGEDGVPGRVGERGEPGKFLKSVAPPGPPGRPGEQGPTGPPGPPGDKGKPGEDGLPGPLGEAGNPGKYGKPGPQGPKGKEGVAGTKGSCDHCPTPRTPPGY